MRKRVVHVLVLVRDVGVRELLLHAQGHVDVRVIVIERRLCGSTDCISAQRFQHRNLLKAHLLGHGRDHVQALHSGGQGQSNASVARGWFDESVSFLKRPILKPLQQHALANAILH